MLSYILPMPISPFEPPEGPAVTSTAERRKGRGCHQNFVLQILFILFDFLINVEKNLISEIPKIYIVHSYYIFTVNA